MDTQVLILPLPMSQLGAAHVISIFPRLIFHTLLLIVGRLTFTSGPVNGKKMVVQIVNTGKFYNSARYASTH